MGAPRILTFNFHEPYLCLMAKTGLPMDVGVYETNERLARSWVTQYRPVPENLSLVPEEEWRGRLAKGEYDVLVAQNEMNALDVAGADCHKLMVCHNYLRFLATTIPEAPRNADMTARLLLRQLSREFHFVFISPGKQADYGLPGRVILPGIDLNEYQGYRGEAAEVLRVGNVMAGRDLMFDVAFQQAVCAGLPGRVLGSNPGIEGSEPAETYEALLEAYRSARVYFHCTRQEFEDGYNLGLLEAMATGMPVVSLANRTSPLTDGVDGYVSYDPATLRRRLEQLLGDPDRARRMGERARETVARVFPLESFVEKWRAALLETAEGVLHFEHTIRPRQTPRPKLLMHFMNSPFGTPRYFEAAAQRDCHVMTAGFALPPEVLHMWGFEAAPPPYPPPRLDVPHRASYAHLLEQLPKGYRPDLYLWIDSGLRQLEPDIDLLKAPKIGYFIDTHVGAETRIEIGRHFDLCFLAQLGQVEAFRQAGIEEVHWVPLACHPELHDVPARDRDLDWAYVGSLNTEEHDRRRTVLDGLREEYPNCFVGRQWPRAMAETYARAKIVVNLAFNRDVNMRVFEAMASGALLITDEAEGLEEIFTDGKHLVICRDDASLPELLAHYLSDDEARKRIASAGRRLVLREHTYGHRVAEMLRITESVLGPIADKASLESKTEDYYEHARREIFQHIPMRTRRVLDLGCGAGALGRTLREERPQIEEIVGIELTPDAAEQAARVLDQVIQGSIEEMELPFEPGYFDCIICADVLEHLVEPEAALRKLAHVLDDQGVIVISVPNVRFHEVITMLSLGSWVYQDAGIMDYTHLRWFTRSALRAFVESCGLEAAEIHPLNVFAESSATRNPDGSLTLGKVTYTELADEDYDELLVYQHLVSVCKPGPDRLAPAMEALDAGDNELALALALDAVGVDGAEQRRVAAKALTRMGMLDRAAEYYRQILEMTDDAEMRGEYGTLLVGMNKVEEALPLLQDAVNQGASPAIRGALGLALALLGNPGEAYPLLEAALADSFDHISLAPPFGHVAIELGRAADAEPTVASFSEFYPANVELACALAELRLAMGEPDRAAQALEMVRLMAPDSEAVRAILERISTEGGD